MENEIKIGSKVSFKDGEDTFEGTVVENCYDNVYKVKVDESYLVVDADCFCSENEESHETSSVDEPPKPKRGRKSVK